MKVNKSQIARELDVDPRTVTKYIDGYKKSNTRNRESKIDNYSGIIKKLLSEESVQIFYYKRVLWQFLKDNYNLDCAQSSFRRYLSKHEEFNNYFRKRRKNNSIKTAPMRFETDIGQQAQLDWKESIEFILSSGEVIIINIFVLILSYSRFRVYRLSLSKTQDILFSFLDEAFETFGGVPKELLTDNMKTVMDDSRTNKSKGKVNNKFKQFADDYGFKVCPCVAGRPNTKAKVESPMRLLDEIRAYNGILNYSELNQLVIDLNNRINNSCHTTTGKIPILHLDKEKEFLSELPKDKIRTLYTMKTISVTVNPQCMFNYKSNQYSVLPEYIGKRLTLQIYDDQIYVYFNTKFVTIHPIQNQKLNYHPEHYVAIASMTLKNPIEEIEELAKNNLRMIGELYENN